MLRSGARSRSRRQRIDRCPASGTVGRTAYPARAAGQEGPSQRWLTSGASSVVRFAKAGEDLPGFDALVWRLGRGGDRPVASDQSCLRHAAEAIEGGLLRPATAVEPLELGRKRAERRAGHRHLIPDQAQAQNAMRLSALRLRPAPFGRPRLADPPRSLKPQADTMGEARSRGNSRSPMRTAGAMITLPRLAHALHPELSHSPKGGLPPHSTPGRVCGESPECS